MLVPWFVIDKGEKQTKTKHTLGRRRRTVALKRQTHPKFCVCSYCSAFPNSKGHSVHINPLLSRDTSATNAASVLHQSLFSL